MRGFLLVVVALTVGLTACSGSSSPEGTQPTGAAESPMDRPPKPSLAISTTQPSRSEVGELTGTLGADVVEGGCAYVQAPDGTRYEVIYPDGWALERSPLLLRSPDGSVVARGGEEVSLRGALTTEVASICQIGPIFKATEVITD